MARVKATTPAREEPLEIFVHVVKAALALAFVVIKHRLRLIDNFVTRRAHPQAQIHVLNPIAVHLIKPAQLDKQRSADQQAGAGDHVQFAELVRLGSVRRGKTVRMIRDATNELDARMLDPTVGIQQPRADDARRSALRRARHRFEPAGLRHGIVIQEQQPLPPRRLRSLVAAAREAEIFLVQERAQPARALFGLEKLHRAVGRTIVHDDEFVTIGGRVPSQRLETLAGERQVVESGNDDRNRRRSRRHGRGVVARGRDGSCCCHDLV